MFLKEQNYYTNLRDFPSKFQNEISKDIPRIMPEDPDFLEVILGKNIDIFVFWRSRKTKKNYGISSQHLAMFILIIVGSHL